MRSAIQFLCNPAFPTMLFVTGGILLILSALPLLWKRVKPNPLYGFRIPQTVSNERIWYKANSYAAKGMILSGIVTIIVALALRLTDLSPEAYQWSCTVILIGGLVLTTFVSIIYVKRIS